MSFGEKLKKMRKERNWSQDALGVQLSTHGRHIGKYETGKVMPNAETLMKIAKLFQVSVDYLLFDGEQEASITIRDKGLLREFLVVDNMDDEDKKVIKSLIDAYIKRQRFQELMKENNNI